MKIKFELEEESRANTIWLTLEYMGGDADTEHFEEEKFNFPYSEYLNHLSEIEEKVNKYKIVESILDEREFDYEEVKEEHGKEIANMCANAPNDPQSDYQYKTALQNITLTGWDEKGNKYSSYTK